MGAHVIEARQPKKINGGIKNVSPKTPAVMQ
jgi:hypothetical protein